MRVRQREIRVVKMEEASYKMRGTSYKNTRCELENTSHKNANYKKCDMRVTKL